MSEQAVCKSMESFSLEPAEIAEMPASDANARIDVRLRAVEIAARIRVALSQGETVIGFAGWVPEDGSGYTMAETAIALAQIEQSPVLALDGSARHPYLHRHFGIELAPGWLDAVHQGSEAELTARPSSQANLFVIPAGGSSGVASRGAFSAPDSAALITRLRAMYRYILMDLGCWSLGPEALILASACDAVVITAARRRRRRSEAAQIQSDCAGIRARILGVILTGKR